MKMATPMKISIQSLTSPRKVRRVPLRYKKGAKKTVKKLINKGVIT